MMGILSIFANPLAAAGLAFVLGTGFGFVKGFDAADTKRLQSIIVSLEKDRSDLISASEQKDAQLSAHEVRVEEDRATQEKFDAEIKTMLSSRLVACRLSDAELRKLTSAAAR